ncbi:SGNH hydrolase-type esterase domain-containing protein [Talaromyces proteolyticus]|uniref:SGNH hydrolase-type esterase domain-containing protein n=1 Tax=Talaromyces proteolyticus TaxID=1131652 RepID=A0AAD4KWA4_9EURO|nr:SGNH hydrolase-type esterase domain-containing protein [Talaromyces proteolyticus]KAH8702388.1 SGNH hydrolase-type esterase domain-containing protein [Talaromyces proteolyticus]
MSLAFDKVILFGDSITQLAYLQEKGFCFGSAMQNAYCRKLDVIQRGYGGYTSDHAAAIIDRIIQQETINSKIKLIVVFFGTNDSVVPETEDHVPLARYKDNLRKMIGASHQVGSRVILVGPAPFNHHQFMDEIEKIRDVVGVDWVCDRTTLRAREYCDAAIELGKELNVPTVPLWYLIMAEIGWREGDPIDGLAESPASNELSKYLSDGLHFLGPAYSILFQHTMKAIKVVYPELDPSALPTRDPARTAL